MPSIRIGFSTDQTYYDFILDSGCVGVGTTVGINTSFMISVPQGTIKSDFNVIGVTTLASYGGFIAQQQHIAKSSTIGFGTVGLQTAGVTTTFQYYETEIGFTGLGGEYHGDDQYFNTLSEDLVIDDGKILNIANTEMVGVTTIGEHDPHTHASHLCAGLEQVSVTGHFSVPCGGINERKENPVEGTVRFNDDLNTLEFYNGVEWRQFTYNQGQSGRAVFAGGYTPTADAAGSFASVIDYVNIHSRGNAISFGDMSAGTYAAPFGFSSETRGVFGGGYKNSPSTANNNDVAYITIASQGNTVDFGNLFNDKNWGKIAASSSTRGLAMGGFTSNNVIDYAEINTTGNFLEFGDLSEPGFGGTGMGSPTRAICVGQGNPSNGEIIDAITIASTGNAVEFAKMDGDNGLYNSGGSNSVRGLFNKIRTETTLVQSLTIASFGSVQDFGNLASTLTSSNYPGGNGNDASQTTLLYAGGANTSNAVNTIESITITTAGNATDFGDLTTKRGYMGSCSDSHGGLGGF